MRNEAKILLITTGGTIAGESVKTNLNITDFNNVILPSLKRISVTKKIHITPFEICKKDSSNILPQHWNAIANKIYKEYDNFDGFLITHGTNTLGYTSSALSFSFENLDKPIILTGSQVPFGVPGSDALSNLENAIRVIIGTGANSIKGVVVVFGSYIISGVRAKKTTEFDYDAFKSFTDSSLGRIGINININEDNLQRHHSYLNKQYKVAGAKNELILQNNFDTKIASLTEFPGISSVIFKSLVEGAGIKGIILRSFGAGDVSINLEDGLQYLKKKKIPLIVTTQAPNGVSNFMVNNPGKRLLENDLAIPAWDMSIESQTIKLSWLLGQGYSYEEIKVKMIEDLKGEINVTN